MKKVTMILCKLKLENFKKYESYSLEFKEGLVGIIGKNGSGKSTIFEAILFALYGSLKNKGYKDTIRNSNATTKDIVLVELDFEFEGLEYKVSREFKGKALSANAKFYKNNELIVSGAKEVTTSIVNLTKMNMDAFLHTLFASQKELTNLSNSKPEDRKKMIRKLLGLEKIDFVEKELIEKSRQLKREIGAFAEVLLSNEEVEVKKSHIVEYKEQTTQLQNQVDTKTKEINQSKLLEVDIQKELAIFLKTKEQKLNHASQCEILKTSINSHIRNQAKLNDDVNTLKQKQNELKGLESIKQEYVKVHDSIKEQEKLKEHHIRKEGLTKEQESLREQYSKSKESIVELKEQTKEHKTLIEKEKELEKHIVEYKQKLELKLQEEKSIEKTIAGEDKLIADVNTKIKKIKDLGRESNCPTCTRPLLDEYDNVLESLEDIVKQTKNEKIQKHKEELEALKKQKEELQKSFESTNHEYFTTSKSVNLIESKKRDLVKEEEHFEKVKAHGLKNKTELEKLSTFIYDETAHTNALEKQKELKSKYEYVLGLETMLLRLDKVQDELNTVTTTISDLSKKYEALELEYKQINYDEVKHKEKEKNFDEVKKQKLSQFNNKLKHLFYLHLVAYQKYLSILFFYSMKSF